MRLIAFDPGVTTGFCYTDWHLETTPSFVGGILGPNPHHWALWKLVDSYRPDVIISEHFIQTGSYAVLDSREYEGILKLYAAMYAIPIQLQNASLAKGLFTDKKVPEKMNKHTKDALRHLLYYISVVLHDHRFLNSERPPLDGPELQ